jgi:hypothetical protein
MHSAMSWVLSCGIALYGCKWSDGQCQQDSQSIQSLMHNEAASCDEDADCQLVSLQCPFGCWAPLNVEEARWFSLNDRIERYRGNCIDCLYMCFKTDAKTGCRHGHCVLIR